ncbi:MAG: DoxX family protein [Anaerolineae bacterium]|nr:DoxX family protein [Anaerolineae bacterium]
MNIALWIVQILLAIVFLMAGFMKATQSKEAMIEKGLDWVEGLPLGAVRTIGIVEILGAIGLILPALTGILPWLTPLAAIGLALTMIGAIILHVSRKEYQGAIANLVLLLMALFVAYGRFVLVPVA